ncbi:hypothetical protein ACG9W2_16160, partial [Acinetobacter guillouiae]
TALSLISGVYFNFVIGIVSQNIDSPTNPVRFKESNNLGVEMSEAGLATSPDPQKIMELQKKGTELQQSLLTEMQALQAKANAAP